MAEHIHKTYTCDRCRISLGSERPRRHQSVEVVAAFHYEDGPGPQFNWRDVCDTCCNAIMAFFMQKVAKPSEDR